MLHRNEAKANSAVHASRSLFLPKRHENHPLAGKTMALAIG
jgi:hypothetical protein